MKYLKKSNTYKASNVVFNANTLEAYSYGWWKFVAVVEGKVIFNDYTFSVSTRGHQSKIKNLLEKLNIKIDFTVMLRGGILKVGESSYRHGQENFGKTLQEMLIETEEYFCNEFLKEEDKKMKRNEKAAERREMNRQKEERTPHLSLVGSEVSHGN